jgi:hypothetical protein
MLDGIDPKKAQQLLDSANAGELFLDPETGKGLDKVCDNHVHTLAKVLVTNQQVEQVTGFGGFSSGQVLEKKFSALATGNDRSLDIIIRQHIQAVNTMKEVVAKAIANYVALDEEQRQRIDKMTP